MSTVYKGKKYGKWHIIKRIKPEFKNNEEYKRLFMQEFDNGIQLDHPNIVRLEDKGEDSDGLWFSMEYVDGRSLDEMIKKHEFEGDRNVLNENLVKNITLQLCDALSYVHKKQIVHRDLKPENIMVTYRGDNVKVLDFGLAHSDSYDDNMKKVGTPKYMAPEQKERGNTVDQRADIYALGLIVNEMCTGTTDIKYAKGIKNLNLQTVIAKSVRKNPQDRYNDCQEIIRDLNADIKKAPVFELPESQEPAIKLDDSPVKTGENGANKSKKGLIIGIAAAAVIAIAAIIFLLINSGSKPDPKPDDHQTTQQEEPEPTPPTPPEPTPEDRLSETLSEINNEIEAEQNSEIEALMNKANDLFDNQKNVAQAFEIYEQVLQIKSDYGKAIDRKQSCQKIFGNSNLYDMTPKKGPNGKYGYVDNDGYIIVDYLYDSPSVNKNANWKDIITIQKNGKWGALNNRTKRPASEFKYNKASWGIPGKRGFYLDITNGPRDQIYIDSNDKIISPLD